MIQKLIQKIQKTHAPIVVGLDPMLSYVPVAGAAGYEIAQADSQKGKYSTVWQQKRKTSVELKVSKGKYYKVRAWYKKDGKLIYGAFSKAIKAS